MKRSVGTAWRIIRAVLFTRYDRWEWLLPLALITALMATEGDRVLIAVLGVLLGLQLSRAARAWGKRGEKA